VGAPKASLPNNQPLVGEWTVLPPPNTKVAGAKNGEPIVGKNRKAPRRLPSTLLRQTAGTQPISQNVCLKSRREAAVPQRGLPESRFRETTNPLGRLPLPPTLVPPTRPPSLACFPLNGVSFRWVAHQVASTERRPLGEPANPFPRVERTRSSVSARTSSLSETPSPPWSNRTAAPLHTVGAALEIENRPKRPIPHNAKPTSPFGSTAYANPPRREAPNHVPNSAPSNRNRPPSLGLYRGNRLRPFCSVERAPGILIGGAGAARGRVRPKGPPSRFPLGPQPTPARPPA